MRVGDPASVGKGPEQSRPRYQRGRREDPKAPVQQHCGNVAARHRDNREQDGEKHRENGAPRSARVPGRPADPDESPHCKGQDTPTGQTQCKNRIGLPLGRRKKPQRPGDYEPETRASCDKEDEESDFSERLEPDLESPLDSALHGVPRSARVLRYPSASEELPRLSVAPMSSASAFFMPGFDPRVTNTRYER